MVSIANEIKELSETGNITSNTKLETLKSSIDFTSKAVNNNIGTVVSNESSIKTVESKLGNREDIRDDRPPEERLGSAENRLLEYKDRKKGNKK